MTTWNVNGITGRHKRGVLEWVEANDPDVLMLQETRCYNSAFPEGDFGDLGYDVVHNGDQTTAGVATLTKSPIISVCKAVPVINADNGQQAFNDYRVLGIIPFGLPTIDFVNVYAPVKQTEYRYTWLQNLTNWLKTSKMPTVVAGDFNVALSEFDVTTDDDEFENPLHSKIGVRNLIYDCGLVDAYRHVYTDGRRAATCGNARLDYHLVSRSLVSSIVDVHIDQACAVSDHNPVTLTLKDN